ncbi:hypothetical protein EZJ49_13810 [Bdellovibrio bacteriovorus]|uniref:hypothetical protein n=1 Tax=Bdellovibrio bacteriovorus TaxID=959 RepID=UPI0021D2990C|nr:hypothetical protein [Bdellovibrio bacteriovorus]UXR64138.1 hypothetical protein EZJ49_13810 [Bdellovibrio bacteriovorus]
MTERNLPLFSFCFASLLLSACTLDLKKEDGSTDRDAVIEETLYSCPENYVYVPSPAGSPPPGFCVAKYEMKDVGSVATSQAGGSPWGGISRDDAAAACQALGADYDLISNTQWNQLAQNLASVSSNWSSGAVTSGALNRGHFNDDFGDLLAAGGDDHPCFGLEPNLDAVCSPALWHENRRTHQLSTGKVIWDFAGNSWEWTKDDYSGGAASSNVYISELIPLADSFTTLFAPPVNLSCADPNSNDFCGLGFAWISSPGGAVARGGSLYNGTQTGIFSTDLDNSASYTAYHLGFRCVSAATPVLPSASN